MPREQDSPVDLPGSQLIGGHPLRWTAGVIAVASGVLALTNAVAIDGWAAELEPSAAVARVNEATAEWKALTDRVGLGTPRAVLHAAWKKAQAARLPGRQPDDEPN